MRGPTKQQKSTLSFSDQSSNISTPAQKPSTMQKAKSNKLSSKFEMVIQQQEEEKKEKMRKERDDTVQSIKNSELRDVQNIKDRASLFS